MNCLVDPLNSSCMNCNSMSIHVFDTHTREKTGSTSRFVLMGCVFGLTGHLSKGIRNGSGAVTHAAARVLFNSVTFSNSLRLARIVRVIINDNRVEETKRLVFNLLKRNMVETPHHIVCRVAATMETNLVEKPSIKTFVSRKRNELLGAQEVDRDNNSSHNLTR